MNNKEKILRVRTLLKSSTPVASKTDLDNARNIMRIDDYPEVMQNILALRIKSLFEAIKNGKLDAASLTFYKELSSIDPDFKQSVDKFIMQQKIKVYLLGGCLIACGIIVLAGGIVIITILLAVQSTAAVWVLLEIGLIALPVLAIMGIYHGVKAVSTGLYNSYNMYKLNKEMNSANSRFEPRAEHGIEPSDSAPKYEPKPEPTSEPTSEPKMPKAPDGWRHPMPEWEANHQAQSPRC